MDAVKPGPGPATPLPRTPKRSLPEFEATNHQL